MENNKFLEFLASKTGKLILMVIGYLLIFGVLLLALQSNSTPVLGITFLVCAIFGWKALNRITPDMFLFLSITGWIIYFFIKGFLSIFIGAFVAPFQIANMIATAVNTSLNRR